MTVLELKEYIFNNNKIEIILSTLGCDNIVYHENRDYFSASQPDGDNPQGVNIQNNKYLTYTSYTRNVDFNDNKDLIYFVEIVKNISFIEAIKYLHELFGLNYEYKKQKQTQTLENVNPLEVFEKHTNKRRVVNVDDIHILDEDLLDSYIPLLHINWLRQGITEKTKKKFGLAYSYKHKRIIIPIRYWLTNELVGINMRTTVENHDLFGIKKYYLTPSYQKSMNLYGLAENYNSIISKKIVTVFEAEKSVLKRDSLTDDTCVALQGHTMSDEQARILIGLDTNEIVVALDKDVPIEEVRFICEKFYNIRPVSYIYDKWDLLGDKDSPADASNKIYQFLFKYRTRYDELEHKKYLESLKKR